MQVKFKIDWKAFRAGQVYMLNDGPALVHIERGRAVEVRPVKKKRTPRKRRKVAQPDPES